MTDDLVRVAFIRFPLRNWAFLALVALLWTGCTGPGVSLVPGFADRAEITVNCGKPEQYRDIQLSGRTLDDSLKQIVETFAGVLQQASNRLPAKSKLTVTFTEIDLAGWIPPGRGREVRVVSAAYPAHLEFDYRLSIPKDGTATEHSGHASLDSFNEDTAGDGSRSQLLYLESKLLRNWMTGVVKKVK